jgi:hypothetical protein
MANLATLSSYRHLLADRPDKFSAQEVAFTMPNRNNTDYYCKECRHWFDSPGAHRSVCEIYRPASDESVPPKGKCMFWTRTGERFPLLHQEAKNA